MPLLSDGCYSSSSSPGDRVGKSPSCFPLAGTMSEMEVYPKGRVCRYIASGLRSLCRNHWLGKLKGLQPNLYFKEVNRFLVKGDQKRVAAKLFVLSDCYLHRRGGVGIGGGEGSLQIELYSPKQVNPPFEVTHSHI